MRGKDAQQVINFAKQYVEMANTSYQQELGLAAKKQEREYVEGLKKAQADAEERARVVEGLSL